VKREANVVTFFAKANRLQEKKTREELQHHDATELEAPEKASGLEDLLKEPGRELWPWFLPLKDQEKNYP
jgi:hypothetical protein